MIAIYIEISILGILVGHWMKILFLFSQNGEEDKKRTSRELKIFTSTVFGRIFEGINGILYSIILIANGKNSMSGIYCLMASALLLMAVIDWYTYEIPLSITVFLGTLGIIATVIDREQIGSHLIGAFLVSGLLFLLYVVTRGTGIGGGDIKLMAACGLLLGWKKSIVALFIACIISLFFQMIWIRKRDLHHIFAMGPYLAVGIFLAAIGGEKWERVFSFFFPF